MLDVTVCGANHLRDCLPPITFRLELASLIARELQAALDRMARTFKPGDVVIFLEGGPHMTVEAFDPRTGATRCAWFAGTRLMREEFGAHSLRHAGVGSPPNARKRRRGS